MLIRLVSDLTQNKDDVAQRLHEDIESVFEAYGITEKEREALQSRDSDKMRVLLEEELDECITVVASAEDHPEGQGQQLEALAVLEAYGITMEDFRAPGAGAFMKRIQAREQLGASLHQVSTRMAIPAPWPPEIWLNKPPRVKIEPDQVTAKKQEQVTVTCLDSTSGAPLNIGPEDFTFYFCEVVQDTEVEVKVTPTEYNRSARKLVMKAKFENPGNYDVYVEGPEIPKRKIAAAGLTVKKP